MKLAAQIASTLVGVALLAFGAWSEFGWDGLAMVAGAILVLLGLLVDL